jgi:hypothetical protein
MKKITLFSIFILSFLLVDSVSAYSFTPNPIYNDSTGFALSSDIDGNNGYVICLKNPDGSSNEDFGCFDYSSNASIPDRLPYMSYGVNTAVVLNFTVSGWTDARYGSLSTALSHPSYVASFTIERINSNTPSDPDPIIGCMDNTANNYDPTATEDTDPTSCTYDPDFPVVEGDYSFTLDSYSALSEGLLSFAFLGVVFGLLLSIFYSKD